MEIIDKLAEMTGLKFEDLNVAERETVMNWVNTLEAKEVTLDSLRVFISDLKRAVENQLAVDNLNKKQDLFLKARLKNLIAIEGFMGGAEKAKKALELYLKKLQK